VTGHCGFGLRASTDLDATRWCGWSAPAGATAGLRCAKSNPGLTDLPPRFGTGAPGFSPDMVVVKELRVIGALGVDITAYRAALDLLTSGRYPFESLPRRCVCLEDAEDLLATMAGERDGVPPVHGVLTS